MDLIPRLSLNKQPKDCTNLSFVNARNIRISDEGTTIINEESLEINSVIANEIVSKLTSNYRIIHIIPCDDELVIFVGKTKGNNKSLHIFRYNEKDNKCILVKSNLPSDNDNTKYKISGDFTYNVDNALIITYCVYDGVIDLPMCTLNLGEWNDVYDNINDFSKCKIPNDLLLSNDKISIVPEVKIPSFNKVEFTSGRTYKGWYQFYIRYKISEYNYTQWYNFGYPIHNTSLVNNVILNYCYGLSPISVTKANVDGLRYLDGYCSGFSDYINDELDICTNDIKINIKDNNNFTDYQIGVAITTKSYTKAFRTSDINISNKEINVSDINIDASIDELNIEFYNYFNVKNIINYKNRLYISNYRESDINNSKLQTIANNVTLGLIVDENKIEDVNEEELSVIKTERRLGEVKDGTIIINSQVVTIDEKDKDNERYYFTLNKLLNCDEQQDITIKCYKPENKYNESSHTSVPDIAINFVIEMYDIARYVNRCNIKHNGNYLGSGDNINETDYFDIYIDDKLIYEIRNYDNNVSRKITYPEKSSTSYYLDTNKNINNRQSNSTLIPNEVYSFYIHFVDKYGHATNGYKLKNKTNIIYKTNYDVHYNDHSLYAVEKDLSRILLVPNKLSKDIELEDCTYIYNATVEIIDNNINISGKLVNKYSTDRPEVLSFDDAYNIFMKQSIADCYPDEYCNDYVGNVFLHYINSNNDDLFKVPNIDMAKHNIGINVQNITIPDNYIGYFISYEKPEKLKLYKGILTKSDFIHKNYTEDYVYYKNDNEGKGAGYTCVRYFNPKNFSSSDTMYFYSDELNIEDSLNINVSYMKIRKINSFDNLDNKNTSFKYPAKAFNYPHSLNTPERIHNKNNNLVDNLDIAYKLEDVKLVVADEFKTNRVGVGTALSIKCINDLFTDKQVEEEFEINANIHSDLKANTNIYLVDLFKSDKDIYSKKEKTLIRCSDTIYNNNPIDIYNYFNGYKTYGSAIVYNADGLLYNTADNTARRLVDNSLYFDPIHILWWKGGDYNSENYPTNEPKNYPAYKTTRNRNFDFVRYFQYLNCTDYFHEDKSFQNNPQNIIYLTAFDETILDEKANVFTSKSLENYYATGAMVTPANSVDLFQNKIGSISQFTQKHYFNYDEDLINVTEFNKTIRRSAVIGDESRENAWRKFAIEGYKNITENKGKITRLTGIGTLLLVHCEHSLFMFDVDNSLSTVDKQIQLYSPDTFEVQYKEIFTSNLGFGGLQDKDSAIVDEFGYIFYDTDKSVFYRYDAGKLNIISSDIQLWLNKFKPTNIRYANDKKHNRLLISLDYLDKNVVLSYSYRANSFISIHDHTFTNGYNTKNKLYIVHDYNQMFNSNQLPSFISNFANSYNITFGKGTNQVKTTTSSISIIINPEYTINKFLEHIKYSFNKIDINKENDQIIFPVEGIGVIDTTYDNPIIEPYSGFTIKVFNNQCNTGTLNILVDNELTKNAVMDYNKPHWLLGSWTFNYLRNVVKLKGINTIADKMSRMFGNYFIVEFVFNDASKKENNYRYEFEDFDYKLSKDRIG